MTEKTYEQKYQEQDRLVQENMALVQPFLKNFSETYDLGTGFYEDVIICSGPHSNFFWNTEMGNKYRSLYEAGKIGIYCLRWGDGAFIIDYKFDGNRIYRYKDQLFQAPHSTPVNAYFLHDAKQYPVSMGVALAAKDLYLAQTYRGVLCDCMQIQQQYK